MCVDRMQLGSMHLGHALRNWNWSSNCYSVDKMAEPAATNVAPYPSAIDLFLMDSANSQSSPIEIVGHSKCGDFNIVAN
jgi:hypothetical protein